MGTEANMPAPKIERDHDQMAERDNELQMLKERVAVLEKIVTDNHQSNNLADEIERLRDRK